MTVIVDTNILFSACLTQSGKIFELLFNIPANTNLISGYYAIEELMLHKEKLFRLSHHTVKDLDKLISSVLKQIDFLTENDIEDKFWQEADRLTKGVDSKDISFVALTLQTGGLLWTGDKKLTDHLKVMGFDRVVNTAGLYDLLNIG